MTLRINISCLFLGLVVWGCAEQRPNPDDFEKFHSEVQYKLAGRCKCDFVGTNDHSFFDVIPIGSRALIIVSKWKFYTQKEWEKQYREQTNLFALITTKTNLEHAEAAKAFAALTNHIMLPDGSYRRIGVNVHLEDIDIAYPEMERDRAQAEKYYQDIIGLLKPYHVPGQ